MYNQTKTKKDLKAGWLINNHYVNHTNQIHSLKTITLRIILIASYAYDMIVALFRCLFILT